MHPSAVGRDGRAVQPRTCSVGLGHPAPAGHCCSARVPRHTNQCCMGTEQRLARAQLSPRHLSWATWAGREQQDPVWSHTREQRWCRSRTR